MRNYNLNILRFFTSVFLIVAFSCSTDSNENQMLIKDNEINNNRIDLGLLHNEGLEYYYNYRELDIIQNDLKLFSKELLDVNKTLYPEIFGDVDLNTVLDINRQLFGTVNKNDFKYAETLLSLNNRFKEEGYISSGLANILESFIKDNPSIDEVVETIEHYKSKNELSENDTKTVENFMTILNASDEFWNNKKPDIVNSKIWGCNPNHQVRFADAMGGIFGGMIGFAMTPGLGAVIGGSIGSQAMSALVEEMQDQNGGGCI